MKTVKSTIGIALLVAVALFAVSCGGGNSKKQSGDASETKTETKAEASKGGGNWTNNDFTSQVPKPDIAVKSAYTTGESNNVYMVNFDKPTLEQVKTYAAKVKTDGFNVDAHESDDGEYYSYDAKNAAGWKVFISLTPRQSSITITKP